MRYSEVRKLIRSGDPIGYTHREPMWKSWYDFKIGIIRMFTKSRYSHVGVAWVIGERVFLLEAVTAGVRIFPISLTGDFDWVSRDTWGEEHLARALAVMGEPYSKLEAIKAPFRPVSASNHVWQCAEYACYVLGLDLFPMTPEAFMTYFFEKENRTIHFVEKA